MGIKLIVDREKFDQLVTIDEWLNFDSIPAKRMYEIILNFVVDENDNPLDREQAREQFKKVPKSEWLTCLTDFVKASKEAFINPTNGGS